MRKIITIVTPSFNEAENVRELYRRINDSISQIQHYDFEILFIDNASTDDTVSILRELIEQDSRIKVIVNNRNFGQVRSPYWGVLQSRGVATIYMASDLQDPPEFIPNFIKDWELGWKVVLAVKPVSKTNSLFNFFRKMYYRVLEKISDVEMIKDATGFGIYDEIVLDQIRKIGDPYPYFRGLVCELGYPIKTIPFEQPRRSRGISKNNIFGLYDVAILGIISHSIAPIRAAGILGLIMGVLSLLVAFIYIILKLIFWQDFPLGIAPLIIGFFFMFGLMFIFIGLLGEYIGSIHTYVRNRPIVVEKERINF
jgi:glycosyltransferase involved in cell wall biosynthesis